MTYMYESPASLAARLKIGREEFAQRLLTSLILDGPYPRWNTRSAPSELGMQFLTKFDERSFGSAHAPIDCEFVDELELLGRNDAEVGGAPDYAVLWADRVWIIELKTEAGSHRRDQIPSYFDLAAHHFPDALIDIT